MNVKWTSSLLKIRKCKIPYNRTFLISGLYYCYYLMKIFWTKCQPQFLKNISLFYCLQLKLSIDDLYIYVLVSFSCWVHNIGYYEWILYTPNLLAIVVSIHLHEIIIHLYSLTFKFSDYANLSVSITRVSLTFWNECNTLSNFNFQANVIFLANILRILCSKLQQHAHEPSNYRYSLLWHFLV